jgi:inner membrane protein
MDSLTQIVLGAGVGEIVLGKKLGNRAFLWGGIAGTIPDLDIIGNLFMTELEALVFHRGVSHSFFFAITFSFLIAFVVHRLYASGLYQKKKFRAIISSITALLLVTVFFAIVSFFNTALGWTGALIGIAFAGLFILPMRKIWTYYNADRLTDIKISYREWYWFFFWTIITHPILDSFTAYGTQLFAPFSDYRVAFNNISVADPAYTLPFLICLIIASKMAMKNNQRRFYTWLGIGISSSYMLFTIYNKFQVDRVMAQTLKKEGIEYTRFTANPSILNNFLWSGVAESGDTYYQGTYSLFDKENSFKLKAIPKNAHLIEHDLDDPTIDRLRWFSKNYYGFLMREDGRVQFNDLRYGKINANSNSEKDYIFRFIIEKIDGNWKLVKSLAGPSTEDRKDIMANLWDRMKGV